MSKFFDFYGSYTIEYKNFFLYFSLVLVLALLLLFAALLISKNKPTKDKLVSYECGFNSFGAGRIKFDIHFFLIAILFGLFDVEIVLLLPFVYSVCWMSVNGILTAYFLTFILSLIFVYEWNTGALVWK